MALGPKDVKATWERFARSGKSWDFDRIPYLYLPLPPNLDALKLGREPAVAPSVPKVVVWREAGWLNGRRAFRLLGAIEGQREATTTILAVDIPR